LNRAHKRRAAPAIRGLIEAISCDGAAAGVLSPIAVVHSNATLAE
jgi:hypothetical protein